MTSESLSLNDCAKKWKKKKKTQSKFFANTRGEKERERRRPAADGKYLGFPLLPTYVQPPPPLLFFKKSREKGGGVGLRGSPCKCLASCRPGLFLFSYLIHFVIEENLQAKFAKVHNQVRKKSVAKFSPLLCDPGRRPYLGFLGGLGGLVGSKRGLWGLRVHQITTPLLFGAPKFNPLPSVHFAAQLGQKKEGGS